ncbi:hypothetical protein AZA_88957 [Nitrospirillum viridazoti Y2]|uniref:Aspartyl protease n=1 Tax=Nitrospirillum amazonense TaxID=28077 RepID=A0A560IBI4_9PROT|nr:hypothetical protein [Nitrospirillum amazonense]EGY01140.1 hypothetical protein AZA_88957 [Nitrospirillum amazonense Y2]TWB54270.1 hypothetical protein FBZ92_11537 [Nitrospirillum amazonense]
MSLLSRSPRRLLAGALIAMGLAPVAQAAGSTPDYSAYTTTVLIPFIPSITQMVTNPDGTKQLDKFVNAPSFHVRIGTKADAKVHTMDMDTGSTGVMLPIGEIVGYTRDQVVKMEKGWEFLSSDNLLSVGYWVPQDLVFVDKDKNPVAMAHLRVLAVEKQTKCSSYDEQKALPDCEGEPRPPYPHYMGVGFGRRYDGQPQGFPDRNALLSIVSIKGKPVQPGTMRAGYIITADGMRLGLTQDNTAGFTFSQLNPYQGSTLPRDWAQVTACVSVKGQECVAGNALIDTGIAQMYLNLPQAKAETLGKGDAVNIRIPATGMPIATYAFTVNPQDPLQPSAVYVHQRPAFANTGRHFLRSYQVAFDADGGYFGVWPNQPPSRPRP